MQLVKKASVQIPANVREALASVPATLATMENTFKINLTIPRTDDMNADLMRTWIKAYADEMNLNAYVPVFVAGHWSRKDADANGNYTDNGVVKSAKWIEPNGVDPTWNTPGSDTVIFRLTNKKPAGDASDVDTTTVTVTQGTPRGARARSRGQQIINR